MSLSGNLGFVSLDEVLRLLIRAGQRGSVAVRGDGVSGRVFVTKGGISLATTSDDEGLKTLLRKSGLAGQDFIETGNGLGQEDHELVELLREISVESIYRLNMYGETFDVSEHVDAPYASPKPFELEQLLEDSRRRLEDWAEVSQVVSDLEARVRFERDLGEREEVKIRRDAWRVLSEVGAGNSVVTIAEELGTTEFWAARIVAQLMGDELLHTEAGATHDEGQVEDAWSEAPTDEPPSADDDRGDEQDVQEYAFESTPAESFDEEPEQDYGFEVAPAESHEEPAQEFGFQEPAAEDQPEPEYVPQGDAGQDDAPQSDGEEEVDPNQSWWKEPEDETGSASDEDGDVEEDTEAFLEKVFSELENPEDGEEEGYGLLRRRRLGAIRDIARDS